VAWAGNSAPWAGEVGSWTGNVLRKPACAVRRGRKVVCRPGNDATHPARPVSLGRGARFRIVENSSCEVCPAFRRINVHKTNYHRLQGDGRGGDDSIAPSGLLSSSLISGCTVRDA